MHIHDHYVFIKLTAMTSNLPEITTAYMTKIFISFHQSLWLCGSSTKLHCQNFRQAHRVARGLETFSLDEQPLPVNNSVHGKVAQGTAWITNPGTVENYTKLLEGVENWLTGIYDCQLSAKIYTTFITETKQIELLILRRLQTEWGWHICDQLTRGWTSIHFIFFELCQVIYFYGTLMNVIYLSRNKWFTWRVLFTKSSIEEFNEQKQYIKWSRVSLRARIPVFKSSVCHLPKFIYCIPQFSRL